MDSNSFLLRDAWQQLEKSIVYYQGQPVGTVAALHPGAAALNYDQIFTRDFFVSALVFLFNKDYQIVRNFLSVTADLHGLERQVDCFTASPGLMPASFKVITEDGREQVSADFGEQAIGRVTPVDSSLWWLLLLRMYINASGDRSFASRKPVRQAVLAILDLYLVARFELIPTLLVPDGAFMIDRRMGMYGHPLDIEVLFFAALRAAHDILSLDRSGDAARYCDDVAHRAGHLAAHLHRNYWLDRDRLADMCAFRQDEFGEEVANRYNIYPESVPAWTAQWMGEKSGYFVGNIGPGRMDFRFLSLGNLLSILVALTDQHRQMSIISLLRQQRDTIIADMPLKACYPALEGVEWRAITGADRKNTPWSYHNGGSWPFLVWLLAAVSVKTGEKLLTIDQLMDMAGTLQSDKWPEYYDGIDGDAVGKEARLFQVWTISGFLAAYYLLENPKNIDLLAFDENPFSAMCDEE
jgi:glycogen debranching enzyme